MAIVDVTTVLPPGYDLLLKKIVSKKEDTSLRHKTYKACCDHAEEMSWHVYGTKPTKLLNRVRPREDPAITKYRLDSYEPITLSYCKKALRIARKIFDPNLYSVKFDGTDQANILKEYTTEYYPQFNSVMNYLSNYLMKKMIADPNSVLLIQPKNYELPATERVEPIATCYVSADIYDITENYVLLFDEFQKHEKYESTFFTYADKNGIYKIEVQYFSDEKPVVILTLASYIHNFNELPVWALTGDYSDCKDPYFVSYFYPAIPFWNEAINDHSDVTGAYRMHMWPQKWEVADECEYVEEYNNKRWPCQGGFIFNGEDKHKCPSCGGSGYKTAKSPYESHLVNRDKFLGNDGGVNIQVPFGYVTVPVDATKMLEDKANKNLDQGLVALNMDVVNEIGLNQSGKAKEMDRTELNDFLKHLASVMYDIHLENIYYYFAKYMFGVTDPNRTEEIEPEISKPVQFDVYSSGELTDQFAKAKEAKLNPSYLQAKQLGIQNKEFSSHPDLLDRLNLELELDPLAEVTPDEVSLQLANKTITLESAIIHDNIKSFVGRAIEENEKFPDLEPAEQRKILVKYADEVVQKNKTTIDTSMIEGAPVPPGNRPPVPPQNTPGSPPQPPR